MCLGESEIKCWRVEEAFKVLASPIFVLGMHTSVMLRGFRVNMAESAVWCGCLVKLSGRAVIQTKVSGRIRDNCGSTGEAFERSVLC